MQQQTNIVMFLNIYDERYLLESLEDDEEARQAAIDNERRRLIFMTNVLKEKIEIEMSSKELARDQKTAFIKIHVPWEVLCHHAEAMYFNMPIQKNDIEFTKIQEGWLSCCARWLDPFRVDPGYKEEVNAKYFRAPFAAKRLEQFLIEDKATFFSPAQRSRIAYEILSRASFEDFIEPEDFDEAMASPTVDSNTVGISNLIHSGACEAGYPLHDGPHKPNEEEYTDMVFHHRSNWKRVPPKRQILYGSWARLRNFYTKQPLPLIREYLGDRVTMYFAWLEFYTTCLVYPALMGIVVTIYGVLTLPFDAPSDEVCTSMGDTVMCPSCERLCPFKKLEESCDHRRRAYVTDNHATVAFACFVSLWSILFLKFWERKQTRLAYNWGTNNFKEFDEQVRPEYQRNVTTYMIDPITKNKVPYIPAKKKAWHYFVSGSVVIFLCCVVLAALFAIIVYRSVMAMVLMQVAEDPTRTGIVKQKLLTSDTESRAKLIASVTATIIQIIFMNIMNRVYLNLATKLTDMENPRTSSEYYVSYTFKLFVFTFVNSYSALMYIAFFKDSVGGPTNFGKGWPKLGLDFVRPESCGVGGCYVELTVLLMGIMINGQIIGAVLRIVLPWITVNMDSLSYRIANFGKKPPPEKTRWEADKKLLPTSEDAYVLMYIGKIIQFGFITLFVTAFPLSPLLVLINNWIEIRVDAKNILARTRRPVAYRSQDIGSMFTILSVMCKLCIVVNGFLIAFTSDFVPRIFYYYVVSPEQGADSNLLGYTDFTLSVYPITAATMPDNVEGFEGTTECRYRGFRDGPPEFLETDLYWRLFGVRCMFLIVFEHVMFIFQWAIAHLVSTTPPDVILQQRRERFVAREAMYQAFARDETREEHLEERRNT